MLLYADGEGRLLRVLKTAEERARYGAPDGYAESLEMDPDTNPLIARHIDTAWNDVRLRDGVLTYKGQPVPVNPPGAAWQARAEGEDAKARILEALDATLADYDAALSHWATLTNAQRNAVLERVVRVQVQVLRYHRRELL
jgi:hypothetical protein